MGEKSEGTDQVVQAELAAIREQMQTLQKQFENVQKKLARGTGDVQEQAAAAVAKVAGDDLRERVVLALRRESLSVQQLAKTTGASAGKVSDILKEFRSAQQVYNVGTAENPLWTWRIGDDTSAAELKDVVRRLISERPMTTRELANATGARMSRVGGVIVEIQRSDDQIMNLGEGHAGRWFLISERARPASLKPKTKRS